MLSVDLDNLSNYVLVQTGGKAVADVPDLRELEGDFDRGVHPLWSDEDQTIVAFAFDRSVFNDEQANTWVKESAGKVKVSGVSASLLDLVRSITAGVVHAMTSRSAIEAATVDGKWFVSPVRGFALDGDSPWSFDASDGNAITDKGGWALYAQAHLVVDMSQAEEGQKWPEKKAAYVYPVAKLVNGKLTYFWNSVRTVYAGLRGGARGADLPQNVKEAALATVVALYKKFGKDTEGMSLISGDEIREMLDAAIAVRYPALPSPFTEFATGPLNKSRAWIADWGTEACVIEVDGQMYFTPYTIAQGQAVLGTPEPIGKNRKWLHDDGTPVMLHALAVHLDAGDEAANGESNSLAWKEILHPGRWFKTDSGRLIEVTKDIVQSVYDAWQAGLPKLISVPTDSHHAATSGIVPVESNRGFVDKLKLIGDRLFGGFRLTDPQVALGVATGSIADGSVYLQPNVVHPQTGKHFPWALRHVLLTNDPLVQDLTPFGAIPASAGDGVGCVVQNYRHEEVPIMTNPVTPTTPAPAPAPVAPPAPAPVAMAADDALALTEFRGLGLGVADLKSLVAKAQAIKTRARDLEVTQIVRALEGTDKHQGVTQIEGRRHWPVVIAAVEKALKEQPHALALSADDEGRTAVDAIVLTVVNAIPEDGRMKLAAQPTGNPSPTPPVTADGVMTEEQAEAVADKIAKVV